MSVSSPKALAPELPPTAETTCFHCGLAVPPGVHFAVMIDGQCQPMCCHGCQAVAEAIVAAGLIDFYRHR
ncbi:MAG: heavy metal translocating P-type ATPase metal-binding domain-containing protein, partial [Candidatus Competibacter sp.]|nr:heavy metal translocating P-type ATPase metal-binding domain-containing protein [Candidatus Competibacter sp.]